MNVSANSREALATITKDGRRTNRRQQITDALRRIGAGTDRDIMKALGYSDLNSVRPRISEMLDSHDLQECGRERDPATGMKVRIVRLRPVVMKQGEMF